MQLSPNQALTGKPYKHTAIGRERLDSTCVWCIRQVNRAELSVLAKQSSWLLNAEEDALVFQLYELTPEEIGLVEGSFNK